MVTSICCLTEEELWTIAEGELSIEYDEMSEHLLECSACQNRIESLKSSLHDFENLAVLQQPDSGQEYVDNCQKTAHFPSDLARAETIDSPFKPSLSPGVLISKYRIVGLLNSGGQGHVYLAHDSQLGRQVAIKVAHISLQESCSSADRIIAEGKMLARLNHPNLAQVYDSGVYNGHPFLVMEYVQGCTLKRYIGQNSLSSDDIRKLTLDVACAVMAIHKNRILHLDLKPENILVTDEGHCKVIDLGTGWLISNDDFQLTQTIGGTLGHMSPEQHFRRVEEFDERTDIFGLGTVLYTLLMKQPPMDSEILTKREFREKLDLSTQKLKDAKLDRNLTEVCLKAMKCSPEDRYQSVDEMAHHLPNRWDLRVCASLTLLGTLCFLLGLTLPLLKTPTPDDNRSRIQTDVTSGLVKQATSEKTFVNLTVSNVPTIPIVMGFWSEQTGLTQLSAAKYHTVDGKLQIQPRTPMAGLDVSTSSGPLLFFAIPADPDNGSIPSNVDIMRIVRDAFSPDQDFMLESLPETLATRLKPDVRVSGSYAALSAEFPGGCGILIDHTPYNGMQHDYKIELDFKNPEVVSCLLAIQ